MKYCTEISDHRRLKWITAKWLTHGKQLQAVALWGKLETPPPLCDPFQYILNLEARLHSLLSFAWTLTPPNKLIAKKYCFLILLEEQIPVSFSWSDFLIFLFLLLHIILLLLIFTKIMLLLFYLIFFSWKLFLFFHVPECSVFRGFIDAHFLQPSA